MLAAAGGGGFWLYNASQPPETMPELDDEPIDQYVADLLANPGYHNRAIYEQYLPLLGTDGLVKGVREAYPLCHDEAHDLGKVLYANTKNVETAIIACGDVCEAGCMHGVMMEFFLPEEEVTDPENPYAAERHADAEEIKAKLPTVCNAVVQTADYKIGDCIHGVGHAVMFLSDYDIDAAIGLCDVYDDEISRYYCATGAYMEYLTNGPEPEDQLSFAPCDTAEYPAACFRYKFGHIVYYHYTAKKSLQVLVDRCEALDGNVELGCFHGIGNGHLQFAVRGELTLSELCQFGSTGDQYVCIEGLMERFSRYYPDLAASQCDTVDGWKKDLCEAAILRGMYDLDKPFEYYQR